ncbi:DUF3300 domain-containing protein [Variovorax sp. LARHSF232]
MPKTIFRWLTGAFLLCFSVLAPAQSKLDNAQLDQLMAPVALYPDSLLSQMLMASTYPDDVKAAVQWSKDNASLSGDAATKAVEATPWDPSVKSLAAFPSVLDLMGRQPDWVVKVGNAFLDQPSEVMDSVQRLRRQAQAAGSLKTNEQQKVVVQQQGPTQVIQIEPANPQVVYVPSYNPTVVYGAWAYPAYPPYYYPPPVGSVFATSLVAGIGFGLGVAAVNSMWGGFNWGGGDVDINVNRYNNVNVNNRLSANQTNWNHNAARRGSTPYNNAATRQRFDSQRQAGLAERDRGAAGRGAAPGSREAQRDRAAQSFESRTGQPIAGHEGRGGDAARDRAGQAGGARDRAGQAGGGARGESPATRQNHDRAAAQDRARAANHDSALRDAGQGDRVRHQAERPNANRSAHGGGVSQTAHRPSGGGVEGGGHRAGGGGGGGGGARMGGGGGGGHRGGGRR